MRPARACLFSAWARSPAKLAASISIRGFDFSPPYVAPRPAVNDGCLQLFEQASRESIKPERRNGTRGGHGSELSRSDAYAKASAYRLPRARGCGRLDRYGRG